MDAWSELRLDMIRGRLDAQIRDAAAERRSRHEDGTAAAVPIRSTATFAPRRRHSTLHPLGR